MKTKALTGKATPIGGRVWLSAVFFGLIGQIAWIVENMYFATFAQDIFSNSGRADLSYLVTTFMVILSAVTATATTVAAGGICDRAGARKPFIAYGYIIWGLTIMLFAVIPMKVTGNGVLITAFLLVLFDCVMTAAGSTANDAAFNAWVADNTVPSNRGKLNSVLSVLPVFAVVIVFIGLGGLYRSDSSSNSTFFLVLGLIPVIAGIMALPLLKDSPHLTQRERGSIHVGFFYGFRRSAVKSNPSLYICLCAACLIGTAQQTFFSYLINFLSVTLKLGDAFVVPMAVIILFSAAFTGLTGVLSDRFGRKKFYIPLLIVTVSGIIAFRLLEYADGAVKTTLIYGGGVLMMTGILSLTAAFSSDFQDHIPSGLEGSYQGVRMCFTVLIPMIVGPVISLLLGLDAMGMNGEYFVPPYSIFTAAAVVAVAAVIPVIFILRNKGKTNDA